MNQSKVSVKYSKENSVFGRVFYYILLEFLWEGVGWGGRLFEAGRLLEVGANSRLGAYSNKYGIYIYSRDGLHIILHSAVHIYDFHIFITLHHHPFTGL